MTEEIPPKEITLKVDYVRGFPCGICKEPVTASRLDCGLVINCGCGAVFTGGLKITTTDLWRKVE